MNNEHIPSRNFKIKTNTKAYYELEKTISQWDFKINDFILYGQGLIMNKPTIPPREDELNRYKYINGFQYVDVLQNKKYHLKAQISILSVFIFLAK